MIPCLHCGQQTARLTVSQRYCPACSAALAARYAPRLEPPWLPTWRRAALAKITSGVA